MNSIAILILSCLALVQAQDYCDKKLCDIGDHIACNNPGNFVNRCDQPQILNIEQFKNDMIERHNYHRNEIASGKIENYESAERMATMVWDDELAKLAELNVKQCEMRHDACRNTAQFKYSGQNLAYWKGYPEPDDVKNKIVLNAIDSWFGEYEDGTMAVIDKYYQTPKTTGHFTVMVADRNIKLGCAVLKQFDGQWTTFNTACNYATTNMMNSPIYKSGSPASKCAAKNPKYPGLCSVNEKYDVNNF